MPFLILRSVALFSLTGIGLIIAGCSDTVTSHYPTRASAEADRLFDRGWLPALIPASVREIKVQNDLDLNLSEGHFHFDPTDSAAFTRQLRRVDPGELASYQLVHYLARDDTAYAHADADFTWLFFVSPQRGHCEYIMEKTPTPP